MFEGEQLNQFIAAAASSRSSLPIPLSFPLHHHHHLASNLQQTFSPFDPLFQSHPHHHHALQLQPHLLPHLHQTPEEEEEEQETNKQEVEANTSLLISTSMELEREINNNSMDPWSDEEVLALLRIRSNADPWFPDFTWEHVSRKLSELGYKRSADKCKEKFEEESNRPFINAATTYNKNNCRFLSELEQICHGDQNPSQVLSQKLDNENVEAVAGKDSRNNHQTVVVLGNNSNSSAQENYKKTVKDGSNKKRKRQSKFEMFKVFCQEFVNKMMVQQEELHNKLIEDMMKRDEEKIAMEEAWKKQELDKIHKEIEMRAQEQAIAGDRQTKLIEYLHKLASSSSSNSTEDLVNFSNNASSLSSTSTSFNIIQNTFEADSSSLPVAKNPCSSSAQNPILDPPSQNTELRKSNQTSSLGQNEREDTGKRWPRDEVMALIKLRCSVNNSNNSSSCNSDNNNELGGNNSKGPLWERISQRMTELGYKRSAKRCKEKWENINKYFRKIKDNANKKRSLDSRTCPYFHQLTTLYRQGTLEPPPPENCSVMSPETHLRPLEGGDQGVGEGGKSLVQAQALDFDQF
ncbi:hypothetical protein NMG60_11023619 [Bertholletia excelsa]